MSVEALASLLFRRRAVVLTGAGCSTESGIPDYRFALRARERGVPIAVVNLGETRADGLAALRVEGRAGAVLGELATLLA